MLTIITPKSHGFNFRADSCDRADEIHTFLKETHLLLHLRERFASQKLRER